MSDPYPTNAQRDRRGAWLAIGGLVTLLGALYLAGWLFVGGSVPSGTTVAGVEIGGMSPDEADARLRSELADREDEPIRLSWQGHRFTLDPQRAGLRLDVEATVRKAGGGRSWNPLRMVDVLLGPDNVAPVIDVDRPAFDAAIGRIARQIDAPAIEPHVTFDADGTHHVWQPRSGQQLDRAAVAADVLHAYLRSDEPIQLRIDAIKPRSDLDKLESATKNLVGPAASGPIHLKLPNRTVDLAVPVYAPALSVRVDGGTAVPRFDVNRLARRMRGLRERTGVEPRNARVVLRDGRPAIVPAKSGRGLDPAKVADAVVPVLAKTGPARTARVTLTEWKPAYSTQDARDLGIRRVVSSFTTYYPHAGYRNRNVGRAARRINGTVLKPGQTFSFNHTVGRLTRANGFVKGYVLDRGEVSRDYGAGVSQAAATAFNAAFFAGLKDVYHRPHTYYSDRFPVGREAMVAPPIVDLRFKNTTPYGVVIQAWIRPSTPGRRGEMHVRMWSTKYWDITAGHSERHDVQRPRRLYSSLSRCHPRQGRPGFDVEVYRYFRRDGSQELDHKETMRAHYEPTSTLICRPARHGGRGR